MAKKQKFVKEAGSDEIVEVQEEVVQEAPVAKKPVKHGENIVTVELAVPVKINDKTYFGTVRVPQKVAECLIHMAEKKQKADLRVAVGKNFAVRHLNDGSRIIKEEKA
jgi:hypothetical protein